MEGYNKEALTEPKMCAAEGRVGHGAARNSGV